MAQTPTPPLEPKPSAPTPVRDLSRFSKTYHALTASIAAGILFFLMWTVSTTGAVKSIGARTEWVTLVGPLFLLLPLVLLMVVNAYDFGRRRAEDRVGEPVKRKAQQATTRPPNAQTALTGTEQTAILRSGIRRVERDFHERLALLERQDEATLAQLASKQDIVLTELTETERAAFLAGEKNRLSLELERIEYMRQDINRLLGQGVNPYAVWLDQLSLKEAETAASRDIES